MCPVCLLTLLTFNSLLFLATMAQALTLQVTFVVHYCYCAIIQILDGVHLDLEDSGGFELACRQVKHYTIHTVEVYIFSIRLLNVTVCTGYTKF
jgi:hypothetical protein